MLVISPKGDALNDPDRGADFGGKVRNRRRELLSQRASQDRIENLTERFVAPRR